MVNKYLFLLTLFLVLPLTSAETFGYGHTSIPSGNTTYYQNITNIYNLINQTNNITNNITNNNYYNAPTVNDTQFSSNNPITINITWLDTFVNTWISIFNSTLNFSSDLYVPYTGANKLIDLNNQNITNVNYINKVAFRNLTTLGDTVIWEIELDN